MRVLWVVGGGAALGGLYCTLRVYRLLNHHTPRFPWLQSIIPPDDYDHAQETADSAEIAIKYPRLQEIIDRGTLEVVNRPPDFDRPMPQELFILGTAHVSRQTADDVYNCIMEVEPEAVVVELCRGRAFMMYRDPHPLPAASHADDSALTELAAVMHASPRGSNILQILISWLYLRVEKKLQVTPGLEFIKARHAIDALSARATQQEQQQQQQQQQGCTDQRQQEQLLKQASQSIKVYLGDAPVQQTLSRLWGVLSVRQKIKLIWTLLCDMSSLDIKEEDIEALLRDEDIHQLVQKAFGPDFAPIIEPLVHERNWKLASTVHLAAQQGHSKRVVCVVGKGHVRGIVYCLTHPWKTRRALRVEREQQ